MSPRGVLRAAAGERPLQLWRRARRRRDEMVLVPLVGGAGAFVSPARLVSLLQQPGPPSPRARRFLEHLQARRSRLLVATERDVAISCVRRWNLDLSRIRVVPDFDDGLEARLAGEFRTQTGGRAAWHSAH